MSELTLESFDYELPQRLIAQAPPEARDGGRLLRVRRHGVAVDHHQVSQLAELLPAGSLLVVNDSRVIPARLWARRESGGRVEVLLIEGAAADPSEAALWQAMLRCSKGLRPGERLMLEGEASQITVLERLGRGRYRLGFDDPGAIARVGTVPLPPYVCREAGAVDSERYQTIYARAPGSIAAPTAGLHLSAALLSALEARGVSLARLTLHVGPGTFTPVRGAIADHQLEAERYLLSPQTAKSIAAAKNQRRPVIAVGTTVVRVLESTGGRAGSGRTGLFIRPGFRFSIVDGLLTNFHLPRSTLLMLVCAFAGYETTMVAYRQAVAAEYRFYSYGDAMLVT